MTNFCTALMVGIGSHCTFAWQWGHIGGGGGDDRCMYQGTGLLVLVLVLVPSSSNRLLHAGQLYCPEPAAEGCGGLGYSGCWGLCVMLNSKSGASCRLRLPSRLRLVDGVGAWAQAHQKVTVGNDGHAER